MSFASEILDFMDKVTDAVKKFAPVASDLGLPIVEKVANMADTAVEVAQNVLERAEDAEIVLKSEDKDDIEARIARLHETNNDLAAFIRNS